MKLTTLFCPEIGDIKSNSVLSPEQFAHLICARGDMEFNKKKEMVYNHILHHEYEGTINNLQFTFLVKFPRVFCCKAIGLQK